MYIKSIVLERIGPYFNKTQFDFSVEKGKNIVLIGGKNGSGKTTLLKAIKIGLLGSYAFGFKSINESYLKIVKSILNINNQLSEHKIELHLELMQGFSVNEYKINRVWKNGEGQLSEHLEVFKFDKLLSANEQYEFLEFVRYNYPPQFLDSALFDGEKIADIIDKDEVGKYLENLFDISFNLVHLSKLSNDIEDYLKKEGKNKLFTLEEQTLFDSEQNLSLTNESIRSNEIKQRSITRVIESLYFDKKVKEAEFKKYKGLTSKEKETVLVRINENEKERSKTSQKIKGFLENDVIYYANRNLIRILKDKISKEKPAIYKSIIIKMKQDLPYLEKEASLIVDKLPDYKEKIIINADEKMEIKVNSLFLKYKKNKKIFNESISDYFKRKELQTILKGDYENSEKKAVEDLSKAIEEINTKIADFEQQLEVTNYLIAKSHNKKDSLLEQIKNLENQIKKYNNNNNSFNLARSLIKVSNSIKIQLKRKYLELVSYETLEIFKKVSRKNGYITNLTIDEDFNVLLNDVNNEVFSLTQLSAGEKQLILISFIYAIFKISGMKMFFIFDTPLSRLDTDNRKTIVKEVFQSISKQVIILSTDSEITEDLLKSLNHRISNKFTLNYIESNKQTIVENNYFSFEVNYE